MIEGIIIGIIVGAGIVSFIVLKALGDGMSR